MVVAGHRAVVAPTAAARHPLTGLPARPERRFGAQAPGAAASESASKSPIVLPSVSRT